MPERDKPLVRHAVLLIAETPPIPVGSASWHAWLDQQQGFCFEGDAGHFTARCELRRGIPYWYAYRRRDGKLAKTYLGRAEELMQERLEQASAHLAGQATLTRLASRAESADLVGAPNNGQPTAGAPTDAAGDVSFLPLSKIKPPILPRNLIVRPRLTQRITAPVTLLIAPSGFGKSTLLNEWQQTCDIPVAWVSLDKDDDHPLRFWYTVITALRTANPNLVQEFTPFHLASPAALTEIVTRLANSIVRNTDAANPGPHIGLILDDYHHIQHPEIHTSLQTLLEHLPPGLQLIIASRTRPPFALGRLRALQMVAEIKTDDFRFTLAEGVNFLQHTSASPLAYSEMQALVKHTEGWVTGLTLAMLALSQQSSPQEFFATFTGAHTYLSEYFTENVLHRQPAAVQAFLLKTSILGRLTGGLCDAVTGQTDGAEMLARLWQDNLFLTRSVEQDWYRYHDLFAEMLLSHLQTQSPSEIPRLHRQAAEWYRTHNAPTDAVHHLLEIEAWEEAASVIESVALRELEELGEDSRLLRWLQQLPETIVQQHKTLLFVYLRLARVGMSHSEVERFLAHIEMNILRKPLVDQTGDEREVVEEIQKIRRLWVVSDSEAAEWSVGQEPDGLWQLLNDITRITSRYHRPELDKVDTLARQVYETARGQRNLFVTLIAGGSCATLATARGQLRRSEKLVQQVLQQALAQLGKLPGPASIALNALSRVYLEHNQLAEAHQALVRAAEIDPNPTSTNMTVAVALQRALLQSAQGHHDAAQATIQAVREIHTRHPSGLWLDEDLIAYQALFCVRGGDCDGAERLLSAGGDADTHPLTAFARAELLLTRKQYAEAQELLTRLLAQYPHGLRTQPLLAGRVMLAIALFEQHQIHQARQAMMEAVRLAAPEAWLRPFLDYAQCAPLLALVLLTEKLSVEAQTFVKEILRILKHTPGAPRTPPKAELAALATAASISPREQQVLQMVSAGASNQEIAAQLSVSGHTVNTHLKSIYRKLGVNNRARAIAQAQALRLV